MKTVEYHVERAAASWKVIVCFGPLDVKTLPQRFGFKREAIEACKIHATRHGFKPLILS